MYVSEINNSIPTASLKLNILKPTRSSRKVTEIRQEKQNEMRIDNPSLEKERYNRPKQKR